MCASILSDPDLGCGEGLGHLPQIYEVKMSFRKKFVKVIVGDASCRQRASRMVVEAAGAAEAQVVRE